MSCQYLHLLLLITSTLFTTFSAYATIKPLETYVGLDVKFMDVSFGSKDEIKGNTIFKEMYDGLDANIGVHIYQYFGIELNFGKTSVERIRNVRSTGLTSRAWFENYGLDFIGYYPIDDCQTFELIGAVGIQYLKPHMLIDFPTVGFTTYGGTSNEARGRISLGALWRFHPHAAIRFIVKAHEAHFQSFAEHLNTYHLGLNYYF